MPSPRVFVHWFYPSTAVGCGGKLDERMEFRANELTCLRSKVTCPRCLEQLRKDAAICQACRLGVPEHVPVYLAPAHVCDPARAR
jgi:hypothetical protein